MSKKRRNVLICGGSGLIGQGLGQLLLSKEYKPSFFTRKARNSNAHYFHWEPRNAWLNPDVLTAADVVINLSGSSIAHIPWSKKRKAEMFNSRIYTTRLLCNKLSELKHKPSLFINASAIGFYPPNQDETMTEESPPGKAFLSRLAWSWETEALKIANLGIRTVIFRIALVLSRQGGFLSKMSRAFHLYMGSVLGNGRQCISWIHIDDLCAMFLHAIENKSWQGVYNAVSPKPISNQEFSVTLAKVLRKPILLPPTPPFLLRLLLGESSTLLLDGFKVSAEKATQSGFRFQYPNLENALRSLALFESLS